MKAWVKELFRVEKPVIGMCHMHAMPGDPQYDPARGMAWVYESARADLRALQAGGVDAVPDTPVFANTGVRLDNVDAQLQAADGAIIGTAFKKEGHTWNPIDVDRVEAIMQKVKELRSS